jgi:hypothetical protein
VRIDHRLALPILATLAFACSSDGGEPPAVATVTVSPSTATIDVGATQQFTATARDADGDVISGLSFTWSTTTSAATVSTNGLATGASAGTTTIRASTGGVTGSAQLTVVVPGPASLTVEPDSADVAEGQAVQLMATARNAGGGVISASISWASANSTIASVDGSGLVMGVAQGTTQVTATAGTVADTATIVVVPPGNVTVTSITPSPMVEGGAATIRGEGFSPSAAQNNVTINGFAAPVTSASDTLLMIDVPVECFPDGNVTVAISTPIGSSGAVSHPMQPAKAPLSMGVGEFLLIQDPADFCLQFGAEILNEEYVFGVQLIEENPNQLVFPRVRGQIPAAGIGSRSTALPAARSSSFGSVPAIPVDDRMVRHRRAEADLRAKEREWMARMIAQGAPAVGARSTRTDVQSRIPSDLSVNDTIQLKVPNLDGDLCATFTEVDAVVRVIGTRGIWLQDIANPAGGLSSGQLSQLSDLYDDQVHDTNVAWFGDFTDLDGNGKVAILITHKVNDFGPLGFVSSTDLFPEFCASSNDGEIYYSRAPAGSYTAAALLVDSPTLLAHELTHVIQFGRRKAATDPFNPQTSWEAESQAAFAEEVNGFVDTGRSSGQNYGGSVAFSTGSFDAIWFLGNFSVLALYQGWDGNENTANVSIPGAPEECSWVLANFNDPGAGPCLAASDLRYLMWIFYRWISDNIAVSQAEAQAMNRALIDNNLTGFANFEDVTGESMADMLGAWAAMLYADDRAASLDPLVSLPTWDLPDVFQTVSDPSASLEPRQVSFNAFSSDVTVRGGSSAYYVISGLNRPATSVRARAQSGALLPGSSQMWIVRLQ